MKMKYHFTAADQLLLPLLLLLLPLFVVVVVGVLQIAVLFRSVNIRNRNMPTTAAVTDQRI